MGRPLARRDAIHSSMERLSFELLSRSPSGMRFSGISRSMKCCWSGVSRPKRGSSTIRERDDVVRSPAGGDVLGHRFARGDIDRHAAARRQLRSQSFGVQQGEFGDPVRRGGPAGAVCEALIERHDVLDEASLHGGALQAKLKGLRHFRCSDWRPTTR